MPTAAPTSSPVSAGTSVPDLLETESGHWVRCVLYAEAPTTEPLSAQQEPMNSPVERATMTDDKHSPPATHGSPLGVSSTRSPRPAQIFPH
ncbi:MAG: hypothetical protein R3E79_54000 [Caldilineaceae bacterium]